jgi:hypothetical protein
LSEEVLHIFFYLRAFINSAVATRLIRASR